MKLTNGDVFVSQEPFKKLVEQKLPVMVSYKLAKLISKLNEQFKVIEEVRQGLIKKYGAKDDKGNIQVKPEDNNFPKFVEEFNELISQEVEIVFEKVKLPSEVDGKPFEIEPSILISLDKFVEA